MTPLLAPPRPLALAAPVYRDSVWCMDALAFLRCLPADSVDCCVSSPPYFGLRQYLPPDHPDQQTQIGLEDTPAAFVARLVEVYREVRRVLKPTGTCWLNLGDSYAADRGGTAMPAQTVAGGVSGKSDDASAYRGVSQNGAAHRNATAIGYKHKDLMMMPARVAIALQDDGWILRSEIVWHKPNPMPESVTDRPTKAHEMVYLLTKRPTYWYDADAIREPAAYDGRKDTMMKGSVKYRESVVPGQTEHTMAARGHERWRLDEGGIQVRNRRSVWTVAEPKVKLRDDLTPEQRAYVVSELIKRGLL